MDRKQTQTTELPPTFESDYERLRAESDAWVDERTSVASYFDAKDLSIFRSLARSALNFDTVSMDVVGERNVPLVLRDGGQAIEAYAPQFSLSRVHRIERQLSYFSRCATYPYPGLAHKMPSIDILLNNQTPWYRQLDPKQDEQLADRLLMTRIISECLETNPDNPERQSPHRLELYEKRAKDGVRPLEIPEFRVLVARAVATTDIR